MHEIIVQVWTVCSVLVILFCYGILAHDFKPPSVECRLLHTDLIYCYKIVFGLTDLPLSDYFQMAPLLNTRGHKFKLYQKRCSVIVRSKFFSERVVNTWNNLPSSVDFSSLSSFIRTVKLTDLSDYLRCF